MRLVSYLFLSLAISHTAWAVPLELTYSGQLTDNGGAPITSLPTTTPVGGIRVTFWSDQCTTGTTTCAGSGVQVLVNYFTNASLTTALRVPSTFLVNCSPGGAYGINSTNCLPVTLNENGVFTVNLFLNPADINTLFPDSSSSLWIQIEKVTVNTGNGSIALANSSSDPVPYRQKFTVAPYCMKVPIDSSFLTYANPGKLGQLGIANGAIGDAQVSLASPISSSGKVLGSALSGNINIGSSTVTAGSVTGSIGDFSTSLSLNGSTVLTRGGTTGTVPVFGSGAALLDSPISVLSGQVGIGTALPDSTLHVASTDSVAGVRVAHGGVTGRAVTIAESNSAATGQPLYVHNAGTVQAGYFVNANATTGEGVHYIENQGLGRASLMRGTNAANSSTLLEVWQDGTGGAAYLRNAAVSTSSAVSIENRGTGNSLLVSDSASDSTPFVIDNAGNVGIGTPSPAFRIHASMDQESSVLALDAYGNTAAWSGEIYGRKARGTAALPTGVKAFDRLLNVAGRGYGATAFSSTSRASLQILAAEDWSDTAQGTYISLSTTGNTTTTIAERMRITDSGNIGIGDSSPDALLEISASAGSADLLALSSDDNNDGNRFVVKNGGNVGIGTTAPATKLDVVGQIRSASKNAGANGAINVDWNLGNLQFSDQTGSSTTPVNVPVSNTMDGGATTLILQGAKGATYTFVQSGYTFKYTPANGPTTVDKDTIYTFLCVGTTVYVSWITGI